jgi:hypothetical protein
MTGFFRRTKVFVWLWRDYGWILGGYGGILAGKENVWKSGIWRGPRNGADREHTVRVGIAFASPHKQPKISFLLKRANRMAPRLALFIGHFNVSGFDRHAFWGSFN